MRRQLRAFYSSEELQQVYNAQYDHTKWSDHIERVAKTVEVLDNFALACQAESLADLSCGDAAIAKGSRHTWKFKVLGDYTRGTGTIETSIKNIPTVDMFLCSETLEHVKDPDSLLYSIATKASNLVLTTPNEEATNENPEHYWSWSTEDIREMLVSTGWGIDKVELYTPLSCDYYTFQMWTARNTREVQ